MRPIIDYYLSASSPWTFWRQDTLDFLERALDAATSTPKQAVE